MIPVGHPTPPEGEKPPQDSLRDCPEEDRVLFGRWASVEPMDGVAYLHFPLPVGPPCSLVLPPASQVRERLQHAIAFVKQQAGGRTSRRLFHEAAPCDADVDLSPPKQD